jgi:hypothetical protein
VLLFVLTLYLISILIQKYYMKSSSSSIYFYLLTLLFITGISFLPQGVWNFIPVVYALLGPVLFGFFYRRRKTKFDDYFFEKYPDLAAKSAVQYGVMKGDVSNSLDLYSNKKEIFEKHDEHLIELFTATFRMGRFSIYSLLILVITLVIASVFR